MTSKRDYFLMAGIFRKHYLASQDYPATANLPFLRSLVDDFMDMLERDNPRFKRSYFINFIKKGRCK